MAVVLSGTSNGQVTHNSVASAAEIVTPQILTDFNGLADEEKEFSFSFGGSTGAKRLPVHVYKGLVRVKFIGDCTGVEVAAYNKNMSKLLKKFKVKDGVATAYFDKNRDISLVFKGDPGRGQTVNFSLSQYLDTNLQVTFNKIYSRYNKKGNELIFKVQVKQISNVEMCVLETDNPLSVSVYDDSLRKFYEEDEVPARISMPLSKGTYYFVTKTKCSARIVFTCKATTLAKSIVESKKPSVLTFGKMKRISFADSDKDAPYVYQVALPKKKKMTVGFSNVALGTRGVILELYDSKNELVQDGFITVTSGFTGKWQSRDKLKVGKYYLYVRSTVDGSYGSFNLYCK